MKLLFRVNASQKEGTGHLYECLWAARAMDAESVFCINADPVAARLTRQFGFRFHTDGLNEAIARERPNVVIVDLVDVNQNYLDRLVLRGARLLIMNALHHPVLADAQVATVFLPHPKNKEHFGGDYVLMKPGLRKLKGRATARSVRSVVILFGGGDAGGFTQKTLRALSEVSGNFRVHVIVGAANKNFSAIQNMLKQFPKARKLYRHITDEKKLARLLRAADLAFASGGYTLAELMHFGVPTIALAQNDVETKHVFPLFPKNSFVNLGPGGSVAAKRLSAAANRLLHSYEMRRRLGAAAKKAVDGAGIVRFEKIVRGLVKPRVLILGASGNLGRLLAPALAREFTVHAPEIDIRRRAGLKKTLRPGDTVVNLVGASTDNKDRRAHLELNIRAQKILLDECRRAGIAKIIFPSSLNVYKFLGRPSRETDPVAAADDYTGTKIAAEKLYKKYAKYFSVIIFRIGSVYGPSLRKGILPQFAKTITERGEISIPREPAFRDLLYADDLVNLIRKAVVSRANFGIFNGASGRRTSFAELAALAQKSMKRPIKIVYNADRPRSVWGDPALARKVLGFSAKTKLQNGLERTLQALI